MLDGMSYMLSLCCTSHCYDHVAYYIILGLARTFCDGRRMKDKDYIGMTRALGSRCMDDGVSDHCCIALSSFLASSPLREVSSRRVVKATLTHLNCLLKSSSISSSSQLSSQSLSPPDFAAPGAAPFRCARSVCESSQSAAVEREHTHT